MYPHIDPIALQIGPVAIHWYGLTYLAAFALFYFLGTRRLRHEPFRRLVDAGVWQRRDIEDILFLGVMGVIVGGRLGYCLFYKPEFYLTHPLEILYVWQGGMSFHGGLLGVIGAMVWFSHSRKRPRRLASKPRIRLSPPFTWKRRCSAGSSSSRLSPRMASPGKGERDGEFR